MTNKLKLLPALIAVLLGIETPLWSQSNPPSATTPPAMKGQLGTAVPPPETTPSVITSSKKFNEMDVFERNAIRREIAKQDLSSIFQAMLDAERVEHDSMKQMSLQTTFIGALRTKKPSAEFLEQMGAFIANASNLKFERDLVLGALGAAATKETVDLLLKIATTSPDPRLRELAGAHSGAGIPGGDREKLSPSLEKVWRDSNDPKLLRSVAGTMADIGIPSGIDLLLSAALAKDDKDKTRQVVAQRAMQGIFLDNAVPPLVARLASEPPASETAKLVVPILVRIGSDTASHAVVNWLQNRPENAAPFIEDLIVQRTTQPAMLAAWAAALQPTAPFRNEQNREAIRAGLAAYRAGRATQL